MASPKAKPAGKKRAAKATPRKAAPDKLRRAARDPFAGPSSEKLIERSLNQGTRTTLAQFRADINWE
jgi:hypothetical protein